MELWKRRRYTSRSESEGHDLQSQSNQGQGFRGQGVHLQGHEHSGQGSHFQQAKMKMEPRYPMSDVQRAQVGLELNHPNHNISQQAATAPTSSSAPVKKGYKGRSQGRVMAAAANSHQIDQSTDITTRSSDVAPERRGAACNFQPIDTTSEDFPWSMTGSAISKVIKVEGMSRSTTGCDSPKSEEPPSSRFETDRNSIEVTEYNANPN
ncbi:hypothetical protein AJ78_01542 [Emergomyces pasteurianus Ep9510]|uniref:Uncharacterized protein n=1 Tax=Emergomyces pasteurianus Ep9510 TaxID=1447872 RepID=A0A1J9QQG4_9EURO|nr:hypothetical protein AJ78_01542 [Emergomyces pasteurianus Ep9510]